MSRINQLSSVDSLSGGDNFPIFDTSNGDARKVSLSTLLAYIEANLTQTTSDFNEYTTQYAVPSATGFNVNIDNLGVNIWLVLTPTAGYATGTITLPPVASVVDKQEVLVNCTQQVTTLTVDGNGATAVTGEPASLGADDFFRLKFEAVTKTWYRVG